MAKTISTCVHLETSGEKFHCRLSPADANSEGNVFLICTHQQSVCVLEALNVLLRSLNQLLDGQTLCLRQWYQKKATRANSGSLNHDFTFENETELWWKLSLLCLFNQMFKFPMQKVQYAQKSKWNGGGKRHFFSSRPSLPQRFIFAMDYFWKLFLSLFFCSVPDPSPEVQELHQLWSH